MFCMLAVRLPAYAGVMAARMAKELRDKEDGRAGTVAPQLRSVPPAGAGTAPRPATRVELLLLNQQLGGNMFSHAQVSASG